MRLNGGDLKVGSRYNVTADTGEITLEMTRVTLLGIEQRPAAEENVYRTWVFGDAFYPITKIKVTTTSNQLHAEECS